MASNCRMRRAELEALRPFRPAARLVAALDREHGRAGVGRPGCFERADLARRQLEHAIDLGQQVAGGEGMVYAHSESDDVNSQPPTPNSQRMWFESSALGVGSWALGVDISLFHGVLSSARFAFSLSPSVALARAARCRRRDLAPAARRLRRAGLGSSLPARRHHRCADHAPAGCGRRRHRRPHGRQPAAPVHHPGSAVRLCERHRLAHRHRLHVRARFRAESSRRTDRLPDRPEDWGQPAGPWIRDRLRRPGDGADDPVEHRTGRRHPFPDHAQCRPGVRLGARTDRRTHRAVPHAGPVPRRPDRLGDVPHRHGAESPGRGARAAGCGHRGVLDAVGDRRGRARCGQPGARAVGRSSASVRRRCTKRTPRRRSPPNASRPWARWRAANGSC